MPPSKNRKASVDPVAMVIRDVELAEARPRRQPVSSADFGQRVHLLRKAQALTLRQLAQRCGLAASTLSKVENGQQSLSYDNILLLAKGLEVDVDKLFYADPVLMKRGMRSVTRRDAGSHFESRDYHYEMLSSDLSHKMFVPMVAVVRPADLDLPPPELIRHGGEEFVYVLEGEVTLFTELYAPLDLAPGDSCYFDSTMGHALVGRGAEARILWVSSVNPTNLSALGAGAALPAPRGASETLTRP